MTEQQTEQLGIPARSGSTKSSDKAYQRRVRRQQALSGGRLTRTGSPIAAALTRVPHVAVIILLLAGGIVGVLWLNTMSDAAGLRATQSRLRQMDLGPAIEAAGKDINALKDPARLAAQASAAGLVVPGDAAMLEVGRDGKGTVIGTPHPVPGPVAAGPAGPATTAPTTPTTPTSAPAAGAVTTKPVTTKPVTTKPVTTKPPTTKPPTTKPPTTPAPKSTAPKSTAKTTLTTGSRP